MKINNYTLMHSEYNPETGVSIVKINTDVGVFEGRAKCHPEEKYKSRYFGCQIAEGRALIAYQRALVKIGNAQLKSLFDLNTTFCQLRDYQKDNIYTSKLRRAMYEKQEWINERAKKIIDLQEEIKILEKARETLVKVTGGENNGKA